MQEKRRSAFTLVELLVVIGIITVLIAIILPALNKARAAALEIVCASNLHQFGLGIQMYADANRGDLPQKGPDGSGPGSNAFSPSGGVIGYNDPSIWFNAIPPYVKQESYYQTIVDAQNGLKEPPKMGDKSIFICPTAGPALVYPSSGQDIIADGYYWLYGTDSTGYVKNPTGLKVAGQFPFDMSYVWNSKLTTILGGTNPTTIKMCQCRPSSEVVLMVEKMANYGEYSLPAVQAYAHTPVGQGRYSGKITPMGLDNNIGQSKSTYTRFTTRHRGGGYLLFADAHVAWYSWIDTQIPVGSSSAGNANQPGKIIWCPLGPTN
ncbi:MAG TPA: type II secretion system protein [Tepidisphaeraceae bacterium]|jgi:prepilin-type N-terminal cleavage/methylation domain-containing protein/prepilin-type processing-associated H-X9-DG protein